VLIIATLPLAPRNQLGSSARCDVLDPAESEDGDEDEQHCGPELLEQHVQAEAIINRYSEIDRDIVPQVGSRNGITKAR